MAKILISWMAFENDFIKGKGAVNPDGPTCSVHKLFFNYDKHILLTSSKNSSDDTKYQYLVTHLRNTFKQHVIEEKGMAISDVISIEEITGKINPLLLGLREYEIDIFISPGTPTMQVAWYLANESLGINTNLFQLRKPEHSKTGKVEQEYVRTEKSSYTSSLIIKQETIDLLPDYKNKLIVDLLKPIYGKAKKIAAADHISVLITGESGTGKEFLAEEIHEQSPRKKNKFIKVNCSALNDELLESRLFGYVKGAFTGATEHMKGLFHEADGGTIFLDEIGDVSPYLQQSLLRAIPKGEILRVGSREVEKVDVRVITATNKNIYELCMNNKFRDDLYYRISVSELHLPSLKEYSFKEKELMFNYLWHKSKTKFNPLNTKLSAEIKRQILDYSFPGNIREMENIIDGIIAESGGEVKTEHLPKRISKPRIEYSLKLKDVEQNHIRMVYEMCEYNMTRTAKILGISYNKVKSKII